MPRAVSFRLIVGLGNPGREYERTRHNVGFMVLDKLASRSGAAWRTEKDWKAEVAAAEGVVYCKPSSYMNLSGAPVNAVARFYKTGPAQTLVVYDDMALPLGKLRFRSGGSAGGHNGMASVIERLGTPEVPRLRIGIGNATPAAWSATCWGGLAPKNCPNWKPPSTAPPTPSNLPKITACQPP